MTINEFSVTPNRGDLLVQFTIALPGYAADYKATRRATAQEIGAAVADRIHDDPTIAKAVADMRLRMSAEARLAELESEMAPIRARLDQIGDKPPQLALARERRELLSREREIELQQQQATEELQVLNKQTRSSFGDVVLAVHRLQRKEAAGHIAEADAAFDAAAQEITPELVAALADAIARKHGAQDGSGHTANPAFGHHIPCWPQTEEFLRQLAQADPVIV